MAERENQRLERINQRLTKLEHSDRFRSVETQKFPEKLQVQNELHAVIELPMELFMLFFTLLPTEQTSKLTPSQLSEFTLFQFFSEPSTPKVACIAKKHRFDVHNKHRVVERIGFRSPFASFLVFINLSFCPTTIFSSWTFIIFPCANYWEFSDHC